MSRADEVDLDRLADYAAGALAPSAAGEVERLVRTDHRWARALDALVVADETVRVELRDLDASHPDRMPADVALRVEDALRGLDPVPGAPPVVSLADARAARQRRRQRFLTGVGAAAATLVLVLCGITVARGLRTTAESTAGGAPAQEYNAGEAPAAPAEDSATAGDGARAGPLVVATGFDYNPQDLSSLTEKPAPGPLPDLTTSGKAVPPGAAAAPLVVPGTVARDAPKPLERLTEPKALAACVAAIQADHPGVPILIDYARYEGRPALIVSVRAGASTTVVAVGDSCGLAGANQIASATAP